MRSDSLRKLEDLNAGVGEKEWMAPKREHGWQSPLSRQGWQSLISPNKCDGRMQSVETPIL